MIRLVHVLGAVMFLGGIIATIAWMTLANRTKKPEVLKFATKSATVIDMSISNPGAFLLVITGFLLSSNWGGIFGASWIITSLGLISISGIVYLGFCLRYQLTLAKMASFSIETGKNLSNEFYYLLNKWFFWSALATILPIIAFFLMFLKPKLW